MAWHGEAFGYYPMACESLNNEGRCFLGCPTCGREVRQPDEFGAHWCQSLRRLGYENRPGSAYPSYCNYCGRELDGCGWSSTKSIWYGSLF